MKRTAVAGPLRAWPWVLAASLTLAACLAILASLALRPNLLHLDGYRLIVDQRITTGHQRAERVAFLDEGRALAVSCPRYNRVQTYRLTAGPDEPVPVADLDLEGRPVAIAVRGDALLVLQMPGIEARHREPGWWDTFDLEGQRVAPRVPVGFYPDDLALTPDGNTALALISERAKGDDHRPSAALAIFDLSAGLDKPRQVARLPFDRDKDDPHHVAASPDGRTAAVTLGGSDAVAWIDLSDPARPALGKRTPLSHPDRLAFGKNGALLVADETEDLWRLDGPDAEPAPLDIEGPVADLTEIPALGTWACTLPDSSGLGLLDRGFLPLRGVLGLAEVVPAGLAYDPVHSRIAVANRAGGGVHLIAVQKDPDAIARK